jgi:hypothetical protein
MMPCETFAPGDVRAAVGAGYRAERLVSVGAAPVNASRHIEYGFGEVSIPLMGAQTARTNVEVGRTHSQGSNVGRLIVGANGE